MGLSQYTVSIVNRIGVTLFITWLLLGTNSVPGNAEWMPNAIIGPVIAGEPVGGGGILFQDIGSGRVWGIWTPETVYDFYTRGPNANWSPDGCLMIVRNRREAKWGILSLLDMTVKSLSDAIPIIQLPIWHPDSRHITVTSTSDAGTSTQIYLLDYQTGTVELLLEFDGSGGAIRWLSATQLLYHEGGYYMVWDAILDQISMFGAELYPRNGVPPGFWSFMSVISRSSNYDYVIRYYDIRSYDWAIWEGSFDGLDAEEIVQLDAENRFPGFDLHDLNTGITTHIDLNGAFVQSLEWSPSGSQIVVTTFGERGTGRGEIYVYNLVSDTLTQAGDFPALFNLEYGPYIPTWSSDEEWLAINTLDGWLTYNLLTGQTTTLNNAPPDAYMSAFTGVNMRLSWSPIMDYINSGCSTNVES